MRLDRYLAEAGLSRSRSQAADLIKQGRVIVNGHTVRKPAIDIGISDVVHCQPDHYVSRAAHKLIGALLDTGITVPDVVLDAGASTGGFTQVLLERGASKVFAVDVGHRQLVKELAEDPRVVNIEGTNLRDLTIDTLGERVGLIVGDVSFISLTLLIKPLLSVLKPDGSALLLVKPQFEVGKGGLDSTGVVRDLSARLAAVQNVVQALEEAGAVIQWQGESALPGPSGNIEYFVHAALSQKDTTDR